MKIQDTIEINGKFYPNERDMTPEEEAELNEKTSIPIDQQIAELKQLLFSTDYKALKYAEGWISEEEYAPIKAERQAIRDRINELENNCLSDSGEVTE